MAFPVGERLIALTDQFIAALAGEKWDPSGSLFFRGQIPHAKLINARARYANYAETRETPIVLIDDTVWGSAKRGLVLTDRTLYHNSYSPPTATSLDDVISLELIGGLGESCNILAQQVNTSSLRNAGLAHDSTQVVFRLYLELLMLGDIVKERVHQTLNPGIHPFIAGLLPSLSSLKLSERYLHQLFRSVAQDEAVAQITAGLIFTNKRIVHRLAEEFMFFSEIKFISVERYHSPRTGPIHGHPILNVLKGVGRAVHDHVNELYTVKVHNAFDVRDSSKQMSLGAYRQEEAERMAALLKEFIPSCFRVQ